MEACRTSLPEKFSGRKGADKRLWYWPHEVFTCIMVSYRKPTPHRKICLNFRVFYRCVTWKKTTSTNHKRPRIPVPWAHVSVFRGWIGVIPHTLVEGYAGVHELPSRLCQCCRILWVDSPPSSSGNEVLNFPFPSPFLLRLRCIIVIVFCHFKSFFRATQRNLKRRRVTPQHAD